MTKNIVVVGAGYAGVITAKKLANRFRRTDYQIVLIDNHSFFTYMAQLHEVATSRVPASHVQVDLGMLFHDTDNVKIVTASVETLDKAAKQVITSIGAIEYEKLVIAIGSSIDDHGVKGVSEYAKSLRSFEDAVDLRQHIKRVVQEGAMALDDDERERKLRLVVIGGGFTGVQLVGDMLEQRRVLAQTNNIKESEISIHLYEQNPAILSMLADENLVERGESYLRRHGVFLFKEAKIAEVKEQGIVLESGYEVKTATVIWAGGTHVNQRGEHWGLKTGPQGRFLVNERMQAEGEDAIYVVGDAVAYRDPKTIVADDAASGWIPQNIEMGVAAADTAVPNIVYDLLERGQVKNFTGTYPGYVISLGSHYALGKVQRFLGIPFKKGLAVSGFTGNMIKHANNLYFYARLTSGYKMYHYLLDEIFRTADGRTPFFGWTSRRGNVLWSLPLRMLMGIIWILTASLWGGSIFGLLAALTGWLLFLGLFTTLAGFFGFVLGMIMVLVGHGMAASSLLMPLASLALMNGAGRSVGLDFWVIPYLEKRWGKRRYGEHRSKYNDLDM
ncbi:NADH dehydrogenase-like protein [Weissella oryzae SG25]|uniref:NADH:ubiquinone reductase (non-electrogenic) n=1 Tax=Weissella oryzae (strain DSM 25784 / JCM 18191 / LMG 30913 / SG25) TaxID=1329250 RepID=A0A069CRG0_WEIOS|nr:FAD-dependent oxidoreductase [Weissella oryzae]GAK29937.1 NADH dehydrogenase-like protein [Weissella oryzae SG25]